MGSHKDTRAKQAAWEVKKASGVSYRRVLALSEELWNDHQEYRLASHRDRVTALEAEAQRRGLKPTHEEES